MESFDRALPGMLLDNVYETARAQFNEPETHPMSVHQLRIHKWAINAYGYEPPWHYVLGIAEEFMELQTAVSGAELVDAYVDITNFACQLCTSQRLDVGTLWDATVTFATSSSGVVVGKLAQITLKADLRIRGLKDRKLLRRKYADWLFRLFAITRRGLEEAACHLPPVFIIQQHTDQIVKRVPKDLPTLNY